MTKISPDNLAHRASRGVAVTVSGLWAKTLIQMISTVALSRLLAPADFGLVAMVTAIVGIADLVRDFGLTGAIIQAREINERLWRSIMWLSLALGTLLAVVIAACAPLIAALYGEPRLVLLTLVIAPTLIANGLAMPMQARLTRELRFATLAQIDVSAMVAGVALSIGAAFLGAGVWSLVVLAGVVQVSRVITLWISVRPRFGRPRIEREVLPILRIGGSVFGAEALNYAERNLDNVIIGQQLGPAMLGQYSRAYSLFLLPLQQLTGPIGRVALPVLSALRDDEQRYRKYIRSATLVIGYLAIPTYAIAAAVAEPFVAVLLGPGWEQAAIIFALLGIAGVAQALGKVRGWIYITMGRSHRQFVYDLVARPLVIVGFLVGILWGGIEGLVLVYGGLSLLLLVPGFGFAIVGTFIRAGDIVLPVIRPAIVAVFSYFAAAAVVQYTALPNIVELLLGGVAGVIPFGIALAVPHYRRDVTLIWGFAKQMRKPKARVIAEETGVAESGADRQTEGGGPQT